MGSEVLQGLVCQRKHGFPKRRPRSTGLVTERTLNFCSDIQNSNQDPLLNDPQESQDEGHLVDSWRNPKDLGLYPAKVQVLWGFWTHCKSRSCPIKCWDGALAPQPLGPKKKKENQAPSKPENFQNTEGCEQPAKVQKPSRPLPIHTTRTKCVLGSVFEPRVQNSDESLTFTSEHPFQRPELGLHSGPGIQKKQDVTIPGTIHPASRHSGQNRALFRKKAIETPEIVSSKTAQTSAKSLRGGHVIHPLSLVRCSDVSKEPCLQPAACPQSQDHKLSFQAPCKRQSQVHIQTGQNAPKKLRLGHSLTPQGNTCGPGSEAGKSLPARQDTSGIGLKGSSQVTMKTPGHDSSMDLCPPKESPFLNLVKPCTKSSPPAPSCVP
ncbi:putative protein FAM90A26 [Callospermophilus lateralis]|uniref:protein FAM90A26-like n=1 Tax=Callospermophilus lateralis TaxID=76772 RepID=UPI0040547AD8